MIYLNIYSVCERAPALIHLLRVSNKKSIFRYKKETEINLLKVNFGFSSLFHGRSGVSSYSLRLHPVWCSHRALVHFLVRVGSPAILKRNALKCFLEDDLLGVELDRIGYADFVRVFSVVFRYYPVPCQDTYGIILVLHSYLVPPYNMKIFYTYGLYLPFKTK